MFNFSMTHRNSLTTNLTCVSSWCKYTNLSGEEKKKKRKQGASASVLCNRVKAIRKERPSWTRLSWSKYFLEDCPTCSIDRKKRRVTFIGHCWQLNCQPLVEETASVTDTSHVSDAQFSSEKTETRKKHATKIWKISLLVTLIGVIWKFSWKQIISIKICTLSILSQIHRFDVVFNEK